MRARCREYGPGGDSRLGNAGKDKRTRSPRPSSCADADLQDVLAQLPLFAHPRQVAQDVWILHVQQQPLHR